jgi:hypothetical protein
MSADPVTIPDHRGQTEMTVEAIMQGWRPDSHPVNPSWGWNQAAMHAFTADLARTASIIWAINTHGPRFADDTAPIILNHEKVVDGHHRLIVYRALGIPTARVETP